VRLDDAGPAALRPVRDARAAGRGAHTEYLGVQGARVRQQWRGLKGCGGRVGTGALPKSAGQGKIGALLPPHLGPSSCNACRCFGGEAKC
jgi:hypothetical protein